MCYDPADMKKRSVKTENRESTRMSNTRREVEFIAGVYYDCAMFVFNSGFSDISIVNSQFDTMLSRQISAGKLKRESYDKFDKIMQRLTISSLSNTKEAFVNLVMNAFNKQDSLTANLINKIYNDTVRLMSKYGIFDQNNKIASIIAAENYVMLCEHLGERYSDSEEFRAFIVKHGLSSVKWETPKIVTSNDGCSGTVYGSAIKYL